MFRDIAVLRRDLDKVTDGNGKKVMLQLFFTYYMFCKAMARDWVLATSIPFYTIILGADDTLTNNMYTASRTPFGIKTLWGALSDSTACFGYHKRFYILFAVCTSMASIIGLIILGRQYEDQKEYAGLGAVQLATILIFLFEYGGATCDSLTQARYTELMKMMGSPTIVSFVWFLMNSCTLVSSWGNLLLREGNYMILLYFAVPAALPMLVPATLNWMQDPPAKACCSFESDKVMKHAGIFAMSMVLACGALGGTAILIFADGNIMLRVVYYAVLSTIFVIMSFMYLPGNIAKPAFYMFLCSTLRLYFSATLQVWYTGLNSHAAIDACLNQDYNVNHSIWESNIQDCSNTTILQTNFTCIDGGPGFTTAYYQFVGNFIGAIAATVAVVIFEKVIVFWNVRAAFWITTVFQMFSTMLEVIVLMRWNHAMFGTDPRNEADRWVDQAFFLIGTQAIDKIVEMLDFMPCNVLIGNLCPKNMEATIFAVLAGSQNFGSNLAFVFGSIVVQSLGVSLSSQTASAYKCVNPVSTFGPFAFNGIAWGRILGGIVLPAITVPLTFILLPDKQLNGDFLEDGQQEQEVELGNPDPAFGGFSANESGTRVFIDGASARTGSGINERVTGASFASIASLSKGLPGGPGNFMM